MPSRHTYNYSSSSSSSRTSSSSDEALAKELGGLSINQKQVPSRLEPKYAEPRRLSQQASSRYESTLITPDTSRSRTKSSYGDPLIRDERKVCKDERRSKTSDSRYHSNSFLDAAPTYTTSSRKERREDSRFYPNSSFYTERR